MQCSFIGCEKKHKEGWRIVRGKNNKWLCVEHAGINKSEKRPMIGRDEGADYAEKYGRRLTGR